ncbi:MAG: AbrB/MazE/SpoVT family DNA-binding domain-containing protein [Candidatus Aenigmarchaeota archaeon]|nr:AbrB/MazE/SpoVT family DNA-binding domain-containing protein [Candidatus Aenigmarchaeota archaeon]
MEMETVARAKKLGGSIAIILPKEIVKEENIKENDLVSIKVEKKKKSYFGALKGIGPFAREDEFDMHG